MIEKVIDVGGKQVTFRSSATVPRLYRIKFKRDIFKDLAKLEKAYSKKISRSEREMTTPLFLLRCIEIGISVSDLDLLTVGLVLDIWTEKTNDGVKYARVASQEDFDKF